MADTTPTGTAPLVALVARLTADPEWVARTAGMMTEAILDELPELAEDPDLREGVLASTAGVMQRLVEMVLSGAEPTAAIPPAAAVELADELVHRGVSLDTLLRGYTVGHAAFFRVWRGVVHEALEDPVEAAAAIEHGLSWTFSYVEAMLRGVAERYVTERERWIRSAAAMHTETVRTLLDGEPLDVEAASRRLGYRLDRRHVAFVVWSRARDDGAGADLASIERAAAEIATAVGARRPLLVPLGLLLIGGWIGCDEPIDRRRTRRLHLRKPGLHAAFGNVGEGVQGFRRSHIEATQARRVAELSGARASTITHYSDVRLVALATADMDDAWAFVTRELGGLAGQNDEARRLAATLRVYLEEQSSLTRSAQRLGVHHNTIGNRVRAAQQLLDEPIDNRPAELLVALRLAPLVADRH